VRAAYEQAAAESIVEMEVRVRYGTGPSSA
jgi:hypothetical protein